MYLVPMSVLIVDIQTDGRSAAVGRPIEVAWAEAPFPDVGASLATQVFLLRLDDDRLPPRHILQLTGLDEADFAVAVPEATAFAALQEAVARVDMIVAHPASFEKAWLEALWARHAPGRDFPAPFLCTLALARRLLPELPSHSLRAVAAHFDLSLAEHRRAEGHVASTRRVFAGLTELARRDWQATTLAELAAHTAGKGGVPLRRKRSYAVARDERLALPELPGVYRMLDGEARVLYVGKATNLRSRVNSYFRRRSGHGAAKFELLARVRRVETEATATALEAALLESDLIKQLAPPYNKALVDGGRRPGFLTRDLQPAADQGCYGPVSSPGLFLLLEAISFPNGPKTARDRLALGVRLARWKPAEEDEEAAEEARLDELAPEDVAAMLGRIFIKARRVRKLLDAELSWTDARTGRTRIIRSFLGKVMGRWADEAEPGLPASATSWLDAAAYDRLSVLDAEIRALRRRGVHVAVQSRGS
jgi:DNA polymerase III epsilon subunit-like protein